MPGRQGLGARLAFVLRVVLMAVPHEQIRNLSMNYHAVPDNMRRLAGFLQEVGRAWRHALLRRSQRRRMPWSRFKWLLHKYLPPCRLVHPHPTERFRVTTFGKSRMQ
ncbi:hypothetical protein [Burkholderia ubonensis]|uniref:hypothetical protein n=1 Tax=Burkholderia ubonensis TaxID=101571 RepID=UPI0018DFDBA1|nr:hypothetical protein [Burkholderia ubonensis]